MKEKSTRKQFDFTHLRVDEKLQGAKLASFTRRLLAYSLDWIIIVICTQFLFLIIPPPYPSTTFWKGPQDIPHLRQLFFWDFFNISGIEMHRPHTIKLLRP